MKRTPEAQPRFRRGPKDSYSSSLLLSLRDANSVSSVGYKAHTLSKLLRQKFSVPDGYVVTTKAYENIVNNEAAVSSTLSELQRRILEAPLPSDLEHAILAKCATGLWAVRSSSTIEDGPSLSFAGQMDTFLNVSGAEILDALRKVWASNFSDRALTYRIRARLDSDWPQMAVLIQRMVTAEKGGVLFTINPSDLNDESMVISVAEGPTPNVVAGSECETYYIARDSGYLLKSSEDAQLLDAKTLKALAKNAAGIENVFHDAMDIEWAIHGTQIHILQARPITSFVAEKTKIWSNTNVGESLPGVATPMTWSIIDAFSQRGFERAFHTLGLHVPPNAQLADSFMGRIYLNLSDFVTIAKGIPFLTPEILHDMAGGGGLEKVLKNTDLSTANHSQFWNHLPQTTGRILKNQFLAPLMMASSKGADARYIDNFLNTGFSRLQHDVLKAKKDHLDLFFNKTGELLLTISSNFILSVAILREAMKLAGKGEYVRSASDLLEGLHLQSSEAGTELVELARVARRSFTLRQIFENFETEKIPNVLRKQNSNALVADFNRRFQKFLKRHGNRAVREAELATPRWQEDPSFPISIIKNHVCASQLKSPTLSELDTTIFDGFSLSAKLAYKSLFRWARFNAQSREELRATLIDVLGMHRVLLLECGRRMVRSGLLRSGEDVFFLSYQEVTQWLEGPTQVSSYRLKTLTRRAQFNAFEKAPSPPNVFEFDGRRIIQKNRIKVTDITQEIPGLSASRGSVTGIARVIKDPTQHTQISHNEILVVPYADIAFTPMFLSAAGIVVELGGPLSHAAIVAREYGIPTVVSVENATTVIRDGMIITVDGDNGFIKISNKVNK